MNPRVQAMFAMLYLAGAGLLIFSMVMYDREQRRLRDEQNLIIAKLVKSQNDLMGLQGKIIIALETMVVPKKPGPMPEEFLVPRELGK